MIVTTYGVDGSKKRQPMGYAGGQCNKATEPYEAREIASQTKKKNTPEMYEPEPEGVKLDKIKSGGGS